MAFKIRIMASHGAWMKGPVPKLVYRAEAYEDDDQFADRKWACAHDHETAEQDQPGGWPPDWPGGGG